MVLHSLLPARGSLTCVLQGRTTPDLKAVADLRFVDDQGRVVFEMLDVEAHRLPADDAFAGVGAATTSARVGAAE